MMKKTKAEKEQEKIEKKLAKANKKLRKKQEAYERALESGNEKKIARADKKLKKAEEKYEKKIDKIEEKYGVTIRQPEAEQVAPEMPADNRLAAANPQAQAGVSSAYGTQAQNPAQNAPDQDRQEDLANSQQQNQQQSTGDPILDMVFTIFSLAMEMQRQRFAYAMALRERTLALLMGHDYLPLYNQNENPMYATPTYTTQNEQTPPETSEIDGVVAQKTEQNTSPLPPTDTHEQPENPTPQPTNTLSPAQLAMLAQRQK